MLRQEHKAFHGMVVAAARRIELRDDRLIFTFPAARRAAAAQLKAKRAWIEGLARRIVGRGLTVEAVQEQETAEPGRSGAPAGSQDTPAGGDSAPGAAAGDRAASGGVPGAASRDQAAAGPGPDGPMDEMRGRALGDPMVKAMLELFPAEITDIENI